MKYHEFINGDHASTIFGAFPDFKYPALNAMRFLMPSYADLFEIKSVLENIRLPYRSCWFEGIGPPSSSSDNERWGFLLIDEPDTIFVILNFYRKMGTYLGWITGMTFSFIKESGNWKAIDQLQPRLEFAEGKMVSMFDNDREGAERYMRSAATHLESFLSLLNCKNVPLKDNPAPVQLNKKRARSGKPTLFSYWTLDLSGSRQASIFQGGTHASPRLHLRRGHVRQYANGKTCWVIPCTVGNKKLGIVHKDYAMSNVKTRVH